MNDFKKFGGFRDKRGGGRFDRPGEGRRGGFGGGRPSFGGGRPAFGGGKRFGGKPSFGGNRGGFGGRDGGDREMFDTTCADCGKPCQVPFRPNGEKPVFCNDCFASKRGNDEAPRRFESREERGGNDRRDERPVRDEKPHAHFNELAAQVRELHAKLDALIMIMDVKREESASAPVTATVDAMPKNAKTKKVEAAIAERKAKKVVTKKKK